MKRAAILFAILSVVLLVISGPGTRFGWFPFTTGLKLFALSLPAAVIGVILSLIAIGLDRRFTPLSILSLGISLIFTIVPASRIVHAFHTAPIHDITTDPADPPQFVAAVALRGPHTNPVAYGGASVAAWQRRAYPDIAPLILQNVSPAEAFDRAMRVARAMEWNVIASAPSQGRIEATATTSWFGFRDDIVVRIRPDGAGSRIDARSLSRVGRGDVGMNAARVREFLSAMQKG